MSVRFNAPPGWPVPSTSWAPGDDWMPDPSWPTPPRGWTFWLVVDESPASATPRLGSPPRSTAATSAGYGTDRGSWLASLRARAATDLLTTEAVTRNSVTTDSVTATSVESVTIESASPGRTAAGPARQRIGADSAWELDGLLTSAGRLDL